MAGHCKTCNDLLAAESRLKPGEDNSHIRLRRESHMAEVRHIVYHCHQMLLDRKAYYRAREQSRLDFLN